MEHEIKPQKNMEALFQQVSFYTPFLETIMEYVTDLKRTERWSVFKGSCPKCNGKDTFLAEIVKRLFYCSSCFRNGDIIVLVGLMQDMSPVDSMNYLIKKYNLKVEDGSNIA